MPHAFSVSPRKGLIHDLYEGEMTVDEIKYVLMEISMHEDFDPDFDTLSDMLGCQFCFGPEEQDEIVELFEQVYSGGSGRSAVLIPDSPVAQKAKTHAKQVRPVREMRVFNNRPEALAWLGIRPSDLPAQPTKACYPLSDL